MRVPQSRPPMPIYLPSCGAADQPAAPLPRHGHIPYVKRNLEMRRSGEIVPLPYHISDTALSRIRHVVVR